MSRAPPPDLVAARPRHHPGRKNNHFRILNELPTVPPSIAIRRRSTRGCGKPTDSSPPDRPRNASSATPRDRHSTTSTPRTRRIKAASAVLRDSPRTMRSRTRANRDDQFRCAGSVRRERSGRQRCPRWTPSNSVTSAIPRSRTVPIDVQEYSTGATADSAAILPQPGTADTSILRRYIELISSHTVSASAVAGRTGRPYGEMVSPSSATTTSPSKTDSASRRIDSRSR